MMIGRMFGFQMSTIQMALRALYNLFDGLACGFEAYQFLTSFLQKMLGILWILGVPHN
jgi:hypothetical protein